MPLALSLRYVVLRHEGVGEPHFDLMFETSAGSDLATWRSTDWPVGKESELLHLRNHRRAYLQYEGLISGDRGQVVRVHEGTHRVDIDDDRQLIVTLETGQTLRLMK